MNISVCITTFNEGETIAALLDSLLTQTKLPTEIVIVDANSTDKTVEIIRHYQKKDKRIKLLVQKCTRAGGRNLSVEIAKNEIIAMTDAGCVADKYWLERLVAPLDIQEVDISAGFYKMVGKSDMQKAETVFLGVTPSKFDVSFLPSTRSVAFRKKVWEEIGGFPDNNKNSAEDTHFNYLALKLGMKYARVKNAIVEWGVPETLEEFFEKVRSYAFWDAQTKIINFPKKGITSHNIKAASVLMRYLVIVGLLVLSINSHAFVALLLILVALYLIWAFRKVYSEFREVRIAVWGPVVQIVSDFGVMSGFLTGILGR